jgi:hypothetical protein
MKKYYLKQFIITSLLFTFLFSVSNQRVYAAASDNCDVVLKSYESAASINAFSIFSGSFISDVTTGLALDLLGKTMGANASTIVSCESYVLSGGGGPLKVKPGTAQLGFAGTGRCQASAANDAVCAELTSSSKIASRYENKPTNLLTVDGSLWGITGQLENVNRQDPVALNLAYYWNDQIAHIPFVNKALAAPNSEFENLPILQASLDLWKAVRNVSLGMISIVLLYTGVMIIMRKKVNPQLVVSVQYAIPKILVGLVLIIFSFPIGAAITGITWALFRGAGQIVSNFATGNNLTDQQFGGVAMLAIVIAGLKNGFAQFAYIVLTIVITIVMLLLKLVVELKAIMIYIKMVMSTITAPFEFALGTIPGNDDTIKNWFTRMAKYGLSVFAMGLVIPATLTIAMNILWIYSGIDPTTGANQGTKLEVAGMGSFMTIIGPLVIVILGFSLAISMESTIDKLFFGGDVKKRH